MTTTTEPTKIKTYEIRFTGRKKGAIGVFYPITAQVFAVNTDAAVLALYERFEHVQNPQAKEIQSPFDSERLVREAMNESCEHAEILRHVRAIQHAIDRIADKAAKANADWHDDLDSPDHGLYHSHPELQFPPSVRMLAAAECALYFMRETPAGMAIFNSLLLPEMEVA